MAQGPELSAEELARAIEAFLEQHPQSALLEDGKTLFSMERARHALDLQHGRCVLQVWSAERNIVRRVTGLRARGQSLLLKTQRMGRGHGGVLELAPGRAQKPPSEKKLDRGRFARALERALQRHFADWQLGELRAAQDLEHSFGPAYVRGELIKGNRALAVIAAGPGESSATIDGILTLAVLWLERLRALAGPRRLVEGARIVVPEGAAAPTAARLAWMDQARAKWELWEMEGGGEQLAPVAAGGMGNLTTRLLQPPDEERVRARFATEIAQIRAMAPDCEARVVHLGEVAFAHHGLVFARAIVETDPVTLARSNQLTFGSGPNETPLTNQTREQLRGYLEQLCASRRAGGRAADPLYRMAPEAWLEAQVREKITLLDAALERAPVYSQRSAFAGAEERGVPDLLARSRDGRLVVIELKANEDMHLALQGLDYWMRVRQLHRGGPQSEFARMGYFPGAELAPQDPLLLLVAPALRIHPATEPVLRHLSPQVPWRLLAVDERWRSQVRVVWRKSGGPA